LKLLGVKQCASARPWGVRENAPPSPPLSLPSAVRADAKNKNKNLKVFLVVVAGLEREKKISIFDFRFSIPKIPKLPELPELRGLRGQSCEKKKVFSA
jgi:hypothetical protein